VSRVGVVVVVAAVVWDVVPDRRRSFYYALRQAEISIYLITGVTTGTSGRIE
jgi:hypothetical protein